MNFIGISQLVLNNIYQVHSYDIIIQIFRQIKPFIEPF